MMPNEGLDDIKRERDEKLKAIQFMIDEIEESMDPSDFQRDFFESLSDQHFKGLMLSDKQISSLKRIYERVTQY